MKQNERALIDLSGSQINVIIGGLLIQLDKLIKVSPQYHKNSFSFSFVSDFYLGFLSDAIQ
jgi:hypothetical protein